MAEYIDREALIAEFKRLKLGENGLIEKVFADGVYAVIERFPAADVAPVVHGHWVNHKKLHGFVYCSACKDVYLDKEWLRDGKWGYCPNCGAKMDGEAE